MKIKCHSESHIVELDDGSRGQMCPVDLDAMKGMERLARWVAADNTRPHWTTTLLSAAIVLLRSVLG